MGVLAGLNTTELLRMSLGEVFDVWELFIQSQAKPPAKK